MKEVVLYLIRHGKTHCNEQRLYCGSTDVSLSEVGIKELEGLKNEFDYPICKLNFTSGAKRANETFEILYPNINYDKRLGFWEYNFGEFEMKSYETLKEDNNYIQWISDESKEVTCPGGESKKQFYERLKNTFLEFINELSRLNENEALIVCHGGTIGTLLELFYDDSKDFYSYQPSCGRGYKVKIDFEEDVQMEILEEF